MNPAAAAEALGSLEFAAVLEVIARRAAGPVAAARLSALRPSDDPEFVAGELRLVGELLSLLRRGERLEIPGVADIRSAVARLRVDGSVLELSELIDIRRTLAAGRTVSAELARVAELAPTLANSAPDRSTRRSNDASSARSPMTGSCSTAPVRSSPPPGARCTPHAND